MTLGQAIVLIRKAVPKESPIRWPRRDLALLVQSASERPLSFATASRIVRAATAEMQRNGERIVSCGDGFRYAQDLGEVFAACRTLENGGLSYLDRAAGLRGVKLVTLLRDLMAKAKAMDVEREARKVLPLGGEGR